MFDDEEQKYLNVLGLDQPIDLRESLGGDPRRIVIATTHRLGDMLVTLPAVRAVRDHFPSSELHMMVSRPQLELVQAQPFVDATIELPTEPWVIFDCVQEFDLVLLFRKWLDEPAAEMKPPWYALSTDLLVGPPKPAHSHYLRALKMLGLRPKNREPRIVVPADAKAQAKQFLSETGLGGRKIRVVVHPGSYYVGKRWSPKRYNEVLRWLSDCYDAHFLVVQGRGEQALVDEVTEGIEPRRVAVVANRSLPELAAILSSCTFFLGNDTGVTHLADAVGLPCVTVYGPSRPNVWGPTGPGCVHLVSDEVWRGCSECSGRTLKDKPCARPDNQICLRSISPSHVLGGIESVAALNGFRKRFDHLDGLRVSDNLYVKNFGRDGVGLVNLALGRPLFAVRGRQAVLAGIEAVKEHGSYRGVADQHPELSPFIDTLLAYRLVVAAEDPEESVPKHVRRDRQRTFGHRIMLKQAETAQTSSRRLHWPIAKSKVERRRFRRRRLRVLLVNGIEKAVYGGGERWSLRVALELTKRGHDVTCWGIAGHRWLADASLRGIACLTRSVPETYEPAEVQSRAAHLAKFDFDAAILCQDRELLSLGPSLRVAGVPLVLARKGLPITDDRPLVRWGHAAVAHGVLTPSERTRYEIAKLGWMPLDGIRAIANGVDPAALRRASRGWEVLRTDLGIPEDAPVVLSVGRLSRHKGTLHLIRAFARVVAAHPEAHLLVIGTGPRGKALGRAVVEEQITDSVHFLGERWDVARFMRLADCFVLPSLYEGMSTALLEAMALGLPVVATAVSGTPEVVTEGETGYLVPPADPVSLAAAINSVIEDPKAATRMGRAAKKHVAKHHGFKPMVDEVEALLHTGW